MPRCARTISNSGIYHAILRGINQQIIFEDTEDCQYFISLLQRYKIELDFKLFAYCLMGNHVHLLLHVKGNSIGTIFLRLETAYAYYFNNKYKRVGHLFANRVRSFPVEAEDKLLSVTRYILCNPLPAGLCSDPVDYRWSNISAFLGIPDFTDAPDILSYFSDHPAFLNYLYAQPNDADEEKLEAPGGPFHPITDLRAKLIINDLTHCENASQFQSSPDEKQREYLTQLKKQGISVRQLNRLTGISKTKIARL